MADAPVHEQMGSDNDVADAALKQRTLSAAILEASDADSVDELVEPEVGS